MRTGPNALTLTVYSSGTTPVYDGGLLTRAEGLRFGTIFPAGLFAALECFIPCDPTVPLPFAPGQRLVARNGSDVVWEGVITGLGYTLGQGAEQGVRLTAAGYWGQLLERRTLDKRWADVLLTDAAWKLITTGTGNEKVTLDRTNRLRFTPKGVAWANTDFAELKYTMPTGQTVKRLTCAYNLQEGAQAWRLGMWNIAGSVAHWSVNASGSGTQDVSPASPEQSVRIIYEAQAGQTPVEDGTYYGQVSSVVMYSETGSINGQEIAKDIRAAISELNADETHIGALTLSLVPFLTEGRESAASILMRAAAYGDASFNSWAPYLLESDTAVTPNGAPVLALAEYPALTDYDYAVRIDEPNLVPPLTVVRDLTGVANWIVVRYRDELDNRDVVLTPDDDANLKDQTSINRYGQREPDPLDAGATTSANAINMGRRYLALHKDPRFYVSGPITVKGYVREKNGAIVPAANIRAGKRVRIENYLQDLAGVTGAGLTFIVTATNYDDAAETCAISTGVPDDLAVFLAQMGLFKG